MQSDPMRRRFAFPKSIYIARSRPEEEATGCFSLFPHFPRRATAVFAAVAFTPARAHLSDEPSRRPHCGISPQTAEYNTSCSLPLPQLPSDLLLGLPLAADLPRRHRRAADAAEDYDDSL